MADNPFWTFSLRLYAEPCVAEACIKLQDEFGVNVNMLLFCCWLDTSGIDKGNAFLHTAQALVARWEAEVILPLRKIRRGVAADDFYHHIKAVELEAERLEQEMLYDCCVNTGRGSGKDEDYLTRYLSQFEGVTTDILMPLLQGVARIG